MKWSLNYNKCMDSKQAYEKAKQSITAETIEKFKVKADVSYEDDNQQFKAKGKGFDLCANFGETKVDIELNLSFLLKPVGNKVKAILEKEFTKVI